MKKCISWNVNGIRAAITKGFYDYVRIENPDLLAIQESKMQDGQVEFELDDYFIYQNSAEKKGYSGVIVFSKEEPMQVTKGLGIEEHDHEGRVLTLEFDTFYFVNVYTPNAQEGLKRLDYRQSWDVAFKAYLEGLNQKKPVICCGDFNVAHQPIDIKNAKQNERNAGYTIEERNGFSALLNAGFIDTFRHVHPDEVKYSWWSYRFKAREKGIGWRIDYFIVSEQLREQIYGADIDDQVLGSDHAPIILEIGV